MNKIKIEGKEYTVMESMGYIHSRGAYGKVVDDNGTERVAIKISSGRWIFPKPIVRFGSSYTGMIT